MYIEPQNVRIGVIGLGYVGLPLAVAFGKTEWAPVIGFNKSKGRVDTLMDGHDPTDEVSDDDLRSSNIEYTIDPQTLSRANFIIVTVPTPVTKANVPDLTPVREATETIGKNIRPGTIVVYESTVYPGVTEEECVPIIEKLSGLKCGVDWKIGYSPERVNPGDKEHTFLKVVKVVSGMDQETLDTVAAVYGRICVAGIHQGPNIKTAEAAKVIENVQRDLNIALMNELSLIFNRMGLVTREVLEAAGTKWNFHKYQPGLVGGHCIGVDPYYLTHKAQELGYHPQVILAGRRINDSMAEYVAEEMVSGLIEAGKAVRGSKVLVLGLTFKENVRDKRNSKIKDTIAALRRHGVACFGYDPNLTREEVESFGVTFVDGLGSVGKVDGVILAIVHQQFSNLSCDDIIALFNGAGKGVLVDIKGRFLSVARSNDRIIYKCL